VGDAATDYGWSVQPLNRAARIHSFLGVPISPQICGRLV